MKRIRKYENEAGAKFHTYQCSKCRGKVDYAQVEFDGVKGEFSVHSNLVPAELKKYIRVAATKSKPAHIRKNPRFKETKMEGQDTASEPEETGGMIEVLKDGGKPVKRRWVGVNIKFSDNHYLASFNHNDPPRIFHNMEELLLAIQVECEKLR